MTEESPQADTPATSEAAKLDEFRDTLGLCPWVPPATRGVAYELARWSVPHHPGGRQVAISHRELGTLLQVAPNTAKSHIDWLVLNGWLTVLKAGRRGGGENSRAVYLLAVPGVLPSGNWVSLGFGRYQLLNPVGLVKVTKKAVDDRVRLARAAQERKRGTPREEAQDTAQEARSTAQPSAEHRASQAQDTALTAQDTAHEAQSVNDGGFPQGWCRRNSPTPGAAAVRLRTAG
ncbi:hypothetical protein [Streptacidiphilus cavernicola]|uniref:Helix-turn-helix domain-containing protein n=1 Tax=Streptacidiphilus cavernicola TaxID=3342716 RepID=A0ABV6W1D4_9ACTN